MFTNQALIKAKTDLYNIIANLSFKDYYNINFNKNGKRKSKKYIPYSLSQETLEALEIYKIIYGKQPEQITQEQEEIIKAYLLPIRTNRTELLEDAGGYSYYNN